MITTKAVIHVHPAWLILFLMGYVVAFYIFFKTEGNIVLTSLSLLAWMIGSMFSLYWYYGIPMTGTL